MEINATMARLLTVMGEVRAKRDGAEREYREACDEEAMMEHKYRQAHAKAMLLSEQKTEGLRQAEAEVATEQLALQRRLAIGLRRSASEALKGCHDDSETLQAAFHALNRQMKVEMDLATHG
jgi:hypothetical protein